MGGNSSKEKLKELLGEANACKVQQYAETLSDLIEEVDKENIFVAEDNAKIKNFMDICKPLEDFLFNFIVLRSEIINSKSDNRRRFQDKFWEIFSTDESPGFKPQIEYPNSSNGQSMSTFYKDSTHQQTGYGKTSSPIGNNKQQYVGKEVKPSNNSSYNEEPNQKHLELTLKISTLEEQIQTIKKQKEELAKIVAEKWSDQVSANELDIENISIKNRPMNLASEYETLNNSAWLDAMEDVDKFFPTENPEKWKFLAFILMKADETAQMKYMQMLTNIYGLITVHAETGAKADQLTQSLAKGIIPKEYFGGDERSSIEQQKHMEKIHQSMPINMRNSISDFLRIMAETVDIDYISQDIMNNCLEGRLPQKTQVADCPRLVNYVKQASRLVWKMVAQRPAMHFDNSYGVNEPWKGDHIQQLYYSSKDPKQPNSRVQFYVHPIMKHGDRVVVKGTVYVSAPQNQK